MAALHFLLPTGDSRSGRRSFDSKLISLLPLDEVPVHVHRFAARALAIRKAPSASVESIEPRPPQPCEVGRPKGRRRKNRRQAHKFFLAPAAPWHPNSPPRPGEAPHPAPSARKSATQTAQKTALCAPCELPGGSESENRPATRRTAHSEVQGDDRGIDRPIARPSLFAAHRR